MSKTAIVAGSTGLVGKQVVKILADSGEYDSVIALVRKGSNFIHDDVFTVEVDYRNLTEQSDELQGDDVFCCLGTTMKKAGSKERFYEVDHTFPLELAQVVKKNGCRQFSIITASGADTKSLIYYNRVKGQIEEALKELSFESIHIFRPSVLLGERDEKRRGEQLLAMLTKVLNPIMVGPLRKLRAINGEVVARAMYYTNQKHEPGIHIYESNEIQRLGQD
jgi:uncharacterized protein YbjT (DUF2867 family)